MKAMNVIRTNEEVMTVPIEGLRIKGTLYMPDTPKSLILFAHGSGSCRFSPRNNFVAQQLKKNKMASFLFDLLTKEEDEVYANRFDIDLLSKRLIEVTLSLHNKPYLKELPMGYFGASTGSASALVAATQLPKVISAIVSRGGRPDLIASRELAMVKAPTLFIVGELDHAVLRLHRLALQNMQAIKKLEVVAGASHLFEESGALETVADLSLKWFLKYLE